MSDVFTREMPTQVGLWEMKCDENDQTPERVAITEKRPEKGPGFALWVHDRELGVQPLQYYHDGLTKISWRKIA